MFNQTDVRQWEVENGISSFSLGLAAIAKVGGKFRAFWTAVFMISKAFDQLDAMDVVEMFDVGRR